ncbi:hypothetical protein PAHAL_6G208100 [Panicum hallii]|uniref:Uncharacterized protein n=1 Tax=Panicum hallii TaxID=206008 RepID=A0A2S3I2U8_9POAL|nr:hypothetical protein PAHAL_6G208100 [Panicum hallii]
MAPYKLLSKKHHTSRQVAARPSGQPSRGSPSRVTHRRRRKGWHLAAEIRRVVMGTGCRPGPDVARLWQRSATARTWKGKK